MRWLLSIAILAGVSDAEKRGVITTSEGDFDQHILAIGGAVVGRQFFVSRYYGLFVIDGAIGLEGAGPAPGSPLRARA